MSLVRWVMLICVVAFGYNYWNKSKVAPGDPVATAEAATPSLNGFVPLPMPESINPREVYIFAPLNCSSDEARRADEMAEELSRRNIPHVRSSHVNFTFAGIPDAALLDRVNAVMGGTVPIVFINGKGKASPGLHEVVAEYAAMKG